MVMPADGNHPAISNKKNNIKIKTDNYEKHSTVCQEGI